MRDYINIQADEVTISKVVDRQQSRTLFSTASQRACVCIYFYWHLITTHGGMQIGQIISEHSSRGASE
jgi:hypothetical protein